MIVLFRTDASPDIGSGHVMRCLSLAEGMKTRGWHCIFACTPETLKTVPLLASSGFDACTPEDVQTIQPDLLVVDHYGLDAVYEKSARPWCKSIAVLDDLANRPHDCDLLIDQTYGRATEDYKNLVPANSHILTGADYMLLRPQFAQAREQAKKRRAENPGCCVLIAVGSTNYKNIVSKILSGFKEGARGNFKIDVVLSSGAPQIEDVRNLTEQINAAGIHKVCLHMDVTDMASMMVRADIAVGAGGTTTWERSCLGLPTLMIELADNQIPTISALTKAGAIIPVGHGDDLQAINEIPEKIRNLLSHPEKLQKLSEASFKICDGMGLPRSISALEDLCRRQTDMNFRRPILEDSGRLLAWRNDPRTRAFSINTDSVSQKDHDAWFKGIMEAEPARVFITEKNGVPVGTIRRDAKEDGLYLSWTVSPDCRGHGIGEAMLSAFIKAHPVVYKALIKEDNTASIHIAEKCGFARSGSADGLLIFTYGR